MWVCRFLMGINLERINLKICFACALFSWCLLANSSARAADSDLRRDATVNAIEEVLPTVVNISTATLVRMQDPYEDFFRRFFDPHYRSTPRYGATYSLGSGVIIDDDGYILTNNHVVQRATEIHVTINTNVYKTHFSTNVYDAHVVASSSTSDVALLKVNLRPGEKLKAVKFAREDDLLLGETLIALGNPFGLGGSVSRGILSSKARRPAMDKGALEVEDWLQTDAAINPGNSGGPLINLRGELIGMNVAVYREENAQGIGFAIPIRRVNDALAQIFTEESKQLWVGARVRPGSDSLVISMVQPGSPADRAGLKMGDAVLQVGEKTPKNFVEFYDLINQNGAKEISLIVSRGTDRRKVIVKPVAEQSVFNAQLIQQKTGLSVQDLTTELADALGLRAAGGVIISGVEKNSPAAALELQRGFLILAVDGQPISNLVAAAKILYTKKKGDKVQLAFVARFIRGNVVQESQHVAELKVR